MENIDLIRYPLFTDKANRLLNSNTYSFLVDVKINKKIAKTLFETLFNVKVIKLNSLVISSKKSRLGKFTGFKNNYKRLFITLKKGDFIPFF
uniref:Large ribosomal subunit protein uL23c n=1 Tax=Phacus pleuronectes TaxID=102908 RepID=A0A3G3LLW0_9EUGL|nr:ribosomal protein L23 [Phacus pleuronectes]AYQ93688.1 ribosomal protein L23 [Phacus pleuronectes]